ncbi:MAG: peptidoglycan/LPS O-acetylase OafA/YrhL [Candidatus Binatia bacterium]|jgi:peptidoglycan/LPS O-acetylase OafA/YrhL
MVTYTKISGNPRLEAIVRFRATAIFLIVAGHSYHVAGIRLGTGFDYIVSDLIKGSTALFVFISGFLFDYVFSARYGYWSFMRDRVIKLAAPYSVLTILAGFMFSNWAAGGPSSEQIFRYFVYGDTFQAYWYIPFILLMFALSPLHRRVMCLRKSHQIGIIILGAFIAAVVQRPVANDNAFQSVVFYLPVYLSGLFLSLHRETLLPILRQKRGWLLLAAVLLAMIQSASGQSDNMHKPFFAIHGFELMAFQKTVLSMALIGCAATFSSPPGRIIRIISDTSFAIFFLHPFALRFLSSSTFFQLAPFPWINLVIATATIVSLCALIALAVRTLLKSNSKYIIGY